MSKEDYLLAMKLQKEFDNENTNLDTKKLFPGRPREESSASAIDPEWETTDPNPDIHQLFRVFNVKFFWNALGAVEVKWSPRMYTCAGICTYKGRGGCIVSLSLPLLKFRPRKDLVETLLHEMIHAYLFVTKNNMDRGSHGPEFCKHMARINKEAGTHITIYHSFHDEVNHYKTHIWRCNGSCRANPPYFGYVRRAVNRAPGPNDFWFSGHQRSCGGSFEKVGEPDNFKAKPRKKAKLDSTGTIKQNSNKNKPSISKGQKDLKNFFSPSAKSSSTSKHSVSGSVPNTPAIHGIQANKERIGDIVNYGGVKNNIFGFGSLTGSNTSGETTNKITQPVETAIVPFAGKGYVLGSSGANDKSKSRLLGASGSNPKVAHVQSNPVKPNSSQKSDANNAYVVDLTEVENNIQSSPTEQFLEDSDDEDSTSGSLNCPVCNLVIRSDSINEHLDECTQLEKVFNSSQREILSDSESDSEEYFPIHSPPSPDEDKPVPVAASPSVSCPNCTALFTPSTINEHLDQCLSFD